MTRTIARVAALLVVAFWVAVPALAATQEQPESWSYGYFGEVMSPFCPGRTLAACTSPQAESLRAWILVQEAAGRSRDDVHAELIERYGDVILSAPEAKGFGIAAYAIPLVVFLVGGGIVIIFLRRQTHAAAAAPQAPSLPLDPDIERAIDEDLAR